MSSKKFKEFLEWLSWHHAEHTKFCRAHDKKPFTYDEYIEDRFEQLCNEFHSRVIH